MGGVLLVLACVEGVCTQIVVLGQGYTDIGEGAPTINAHI